jgi:hypothetical protein
LQRRRNYARHRKERLQNWAQYYEVHKDEIAERNADAITKCVGLRCPRFPLIAIAERSKAKLRL